ncbi:speckle targeted PIP5K1A-regulated poly(A) polymerase [Caerostris extrusa]|uniref:Speckle targeted PIP5K1A-regulated poly(A) polymerase n=1 Tax=Caerostris extrusa TaxID=172846 RepID=A0AAV4X073_CAEEX|nr:speckle targeted PIP5K1A-regulated poly(A) polymerase [Caerostris extrusa]
MNQNVLTAKILIKKWIKSHSCKKIFCFLNLENNVHTVRHICFYATARNHYIYTPKTKSTENTEKFLSHTHLKQLLHNCKSVKEQIEVFDSYTKLTDEDVAKRQSLCQNIEKIFRQHIPECSVHLTGSTASGLGLRGCDVDLTFQHSSNEDDQNNSIAKVVSSDFVRDIKMGKIPACDFTSLKSNMKLHILKNALRNSGLIKESTVVPGHCPILNFTLENLSWDLSVNSLSASQGTNLMLLCRLLDSRLGSLHRLLTYWVKHLKMSGGPLKFKSYAIFLLLVHFLQTRSPHILPSVEHMLDKAEFKNNLDNWSYDISKYVDKFERSENSQSIDELIKEFFFFYAKFDFSDVICPLTNCSEKARDFISKYDSPENKFQVTEISVQDPLYPSKNVTYGVSWKLCNLRGLDCAHLQRHPALSASSLWVLGVEKGP